MLNCKICDKECKNIKSLCHHLKMYHKELTNESYYLHYILKQDKPPKCPICGENRKFERLSRGYYTTCGKQTCIQEKRSNNRKESNVKKYGVEYTSQLDSVKNKIKENNMGKYGVENVNQLDYIKDKAKETNTERYGVESYSQTEEYKQKVKRTCMERYGVSSYSKTEEYKQKIKRTCMERYGVECHLQSNTIKDKIKQTNMKRYGVEFPQQSELIKETHRINNLKKYGVEHLFQSKVFIDKLKQTNVERYGVENVIHSDEIREIMRQTRERNGSWVPLLEKPDFEHYKILVWKETNKNFPLVENIELREFLKYDLDHKYSIYQGFQDGILPCIIGSIHNLEILPSSENRIKGKKCSISKEELFDLYINL